MPLDRDTRKIQNSKQNVISDIDSYPSGASVPDGDLVISLPRGKPLRLYKKLKGMLWWTNFTKDGNQYVDKDITVKNNIIYYGYLTNSRYPCFRAYQGTSTDDQAISTSTNTLVTMDTITYDRGDNYTAGTYRFTAPVDGVYHFDARILWDDDNSWSAENRHDVHIYKNGNRVQASMVIRDAAISSQFVYNEISCDLLLAPDDYIQVYAWHNAGLDRNTFNANTDHWTGWNGHLITAI